MTLTEWENKTKKLTLSEYEEYKKINQDYINTFVNDANNFFESAKTDYGGMGYGTASSVYNTNNKKWKDIESRANIIDKWLFRNRDKVGKEQYNTLSNAISEIKSNGTSVLDSFRANSDFISQFGSEDAYNSWRETQNVLNAEDFETVSQQGASVANPSWNDAQAPFEILGWTPFGDGENVKNMVTFATENGAAAFGDAGNAVRSGGGSSKYTEIVNLINSYMTDEEKSIYNYYIGKGDTAKAQAYLDSVTDLLRQREGGQIAAQAADEGRLSQLFVAAVAGIDQFASGIGNLDNYILGTEADATSSLQYASSAVREDMDGLWGVAYDLVNTTGNMLPSILVGSVTGGLGGALTLGASAAGNAYSEMRSLGYDEGAARGYGLMVGASEAVLQKFLGGISKLGGGSEGIFQTIASKVVPKLDNAIARVAIQLGGNMLDEGLEEAIQEVLDPVFKMVATGEDFEGVDWENVFYSGILGSLSAGMLEGVPTIAGTAINSKRASNLYGNVAKDVVAEALEIDANNTHAQRMQERLDNGKKVSGYQINRLVEDTESTLLSQDKTKIKAAVEKRLSELGENGDVGKLADALTKKASGEELSLSERKLIKNNVNALKVETELDPKNKDSLKGENEWVKEIGTQRINADAYNNDTIARQTGAATASQSGLPGKNTAEKENATEAKFTASADGKTKIGDREVSIKEIASVKGGNVMLRLDDGSTVNATDVEFGTSDEANLYDVITDMDLNAATANAFIKGYDPSMSAEEYVLGFKEAYRYGSYNYPMQEMSAEGFSAKLSEEQKKLAYNLGKTDAKYKIEAKQKTIAEKSSATASQNANAKNEKKSAKIASTSAINTNKNATNGTKKGKLHNRFTATTERQKASLKALEVVADTLGVDIYTYESKVVNGKRRGANGWFDPKDGSIHIDIHAGINGEGTMLFTAAHELTHFIREWSPAKFKVFADFLLEQYGKKGVPVESLVAEQIAKAKRNGRKISYDTAYEEVIADSCESFLTDGDIVSKIAELKAKDKSLWQKIKDFLTKLVDRIKDAYEGLAPDSVEGRYVSEMLDTAEKLKAMWTDALVEASEAYNASDIRHEGQVLYSDRDSFAEDKYFKSQMSKWEDLKHGSYVKVGVIGKKHPLYSVGMPEGILRYDVDKLKKNMADHGDYLDVDLLKAIPDIIADPIAISEFKAENTVSVFGNVFVGKSPMMVGVTISKDRMGNDISKVRTYNTRRDVGKLITDESILYLNEDKKRTRKWFQACGIQVPLGETKFGFIRSISQKSDFVKRQFSDADIKRSDRDTESVSNRSLLANALESVAQNDIERKKLEEYKGKIALIESEQAKLSEIRAKIKELSFAKGKRDTEAIRNLQFEENQTANRINTYDKQLLNLESTTALKGVLEREKKMAYKRAEQRGKDALSAYREKAAKTQRELLTRYQESRKKGVESRQKTAMRHKIKDVVNDLNQYLLKGTKEKHVPIELQKAVAEALFAVNMDTVGAEERIAKKQAKMRVAKSLEEMQRLSKEIEHIQEQGGNMKAKLSRLKTAYDSIIKSEDPLIANSHDEVISATIDKVIEVVGDTPLRDMSLYQLEAVYDMYKMVLTSVRNANKAFKAAKSEEISVIANRVMAEIDGLGKKKNYRTKASQAVSKFDWNNLKPVYAFERIGSDTLTEVFNNVRAGEDTWAVDITEAKEFATDQRKKFKYDSWDFKKRYSFTSSSGMNFELSLDQIMSLYAYSKREQARDHLKKGGIVFDETTEVTVKNKLGIPVKFNPTQATAYNLSDETLVDIISKLTTEQKEFVDAMQDYLSTTMGDKGNKVSLALYGVKLYKEKNYFPLKSATQFMAKAKEQQKGEVKVKNSGFSKETTPNASNPIVLTPFMDVWADHVNDMSMYHAFVLPLEDFYRVYNYKTPTSDKLATESVEMFLQNVHGKSATQYIDQLLKDLNGGTRSDPRESTGKALMSRFKKSAVVASLSVVVQQPTSIMRAMALVNPKYFGVAPISRGVIRTVNRKKHKALWAEVKQYAPVAVIKEMGRFDTDMGQSTVDWIKDKKTLMDKVDDVTSKLPAVADELAWISIWNAVKRETLHTHKDLKPNSEEFLKAVGERFTEVITKTQVYDSVLSRSANMRSKSAFMNMWTSFMAEPTTAINMVQNAFIQWRRGNKKVLARTLGSVFGSVVLNAALVSLVYAMRDDDEDETFAEKYLSRVATEVVDGINPLTYLPFFKDVWSIMQGFDVERADMSLITDFTDSLQQAVKVINKDTSDMSEEELDEHMKEVSDALWSIADNISSLAGLPVKNVRRDINGVINLFDTLSNGAETTAGSLGDAIGGALKDSTPIWGWFPDDSKSDKLYDAIVNGDSAYIDRLRNVYNTESSFNSAIRKALRDNDPRIKEAAESAVNGDFEEYTRLIEKVIAEGNFSKENIRAAVKSEINAMTEDENTTETSASKEVSIYEVAYVYNEIIDGDPIMAQAMKEDIIRTHEANGKDREEAEVSFNTSFASYLKKRHEEGELTDTEAQKMLVSYGGKSTEEAKSKIQWWNFQQDYPDYDDLSESAVADWYEYCKSEGISAALYYDYKEKKKKVGGKKDDVLLLIHSLPLTSKQKDALYYAEGWASSKLGDAPWH